MSERCFCVQGIVPGAFANDFFFLADTTEPEVWINTINKTDSSVSVDHIYAIEQFFFSAECVVQGGRNGKHLTRFICDKSGSAYLYIFN